ncbi:ABC transporter ATP-binding protein [Pararobbsia alpina]|uniref:High-affinity branched-chain amino acid transport ATP-binding protein LivF n=1 Tax=Pararobbsia alpina TaxID=621374 RepID=A0A6S7AV07_9BURK|nr:ABC transporter ATP-binding protein [Pararobbsia alpina]CAB3778677.1 High-affinity branched-chain amino acid transport ATP-binding protein LivF [Pararobbsia alpina]
MASESQYKPVAALEVHELGVRFGAVRAIDNVSLMVRTGERHVLLGTNGAGKTTLFNVISGDLHATSGRIRLFGENVTGLSSWQRARRGVARTYQSSLLFGGLTVQENLYVALRGCAGGRFSLRRERADSLHWQRAQTLAARVGLGERFTDDVAALSHGQQRQLEIGMALAGDPRLLLLDEPAAGLSPAERQSLIELIEGLPASLTIVLIEHDMDVALRLAHQVTVMKDGRLVVQGDPASIRENAQVQRIYFGEGVGAGHE